MAYTVLARRYRSGTFDEVIGQDHVARTLKRAIESDRIAHAFLFTGTRGVGKTSMARILAKALNCEKADRPTAEPCGTCASCTGISRGDDIDVIEIDAASNTGVDSVRDLIDNSRFRPARSRFKVYIVDEVHMLSKSAFNALLKTLEEPPGHVKFILATTEVEKVLPTILSRCQRYDFRNIPTREIAAHLKNVCHGEKIEADDDALLLVAKAGAGSMRDALSLLDRLLSVGEKRLSVAMIEQLLGLPKSQLIFDLAQAVGEADARAVLSQADGLITGGLAVDSLIAALVDHLRNLLILKTCGADSELVEVPGLSRDDLTAQADRFDAAVLAQDITILEELRRQVRQSGAGRALLDATLVRLALSEQFASVEELLARLDRTGPTLPAAKSPGGPAAAAFQKKKSEPLTEPPSATPDETEDDDLPRPGKVWNAGSGPSLSKLLKQDQQRRASQSPPPRSAPAAEPSNIEPVDPSDLHRVQSTLLTLLATRGQAVASALSRSRYVGITDGRAVFRFPREDETFVRMIERNGKKDLIRDTLSKVVGDQVGVCFEVDDTDAPPRTNPTMAADRAAVSPAPAVRITPEMIDQLREREPLVKALMDDLGAVILKVEEDPAIAS